SASSSAPPAGSAAWTSIVRGGARSTRKPPSAPRSRHCRQEPIPPRTGRPSGRERNFHGLRRSGASGPKCKGRLSAPLARPAEGPLFGGEGLAAGFFIGWASHQECDVHGLSGV